MIRTRASALHWAIQEISACRAAKLITTYHERERAKTVESISTRNESLRESSASMDETNEGIADAYQDIEATSEENDA